MSTEADKVHREWIAAGHCSSRSDRLFCARERGHDGQHWAYMLFPPGSPSESRHRFEWHAVVSESPT